MNNEIAVITDLHWGIRSDSHDFLSYFTRFYREIFFPELKKRNIKEVIIGGDVVDRRKYINIHTLKIMREEFFVPLAEYNVTIILGNHDVYHKNSNKVNALAEILEPYKNISWSQNPWSKKYGKTEIAFIPWINEENQEECFEFLETTKAKVVVGHFEIAGFEQDRGNVSLHGLDRNIFNRFDLVLSGHFHHASFYKPVKYLGSPYENTFIDYDDPKGFYFLDTDTLELDFIQNPYRMFHKIEYREGTTISDYTPFCGGIVKVFVYSGKGTPFYDHFISEMEKVASKVSVIDMSEGILGNLRDDVSIEKMEDTLDFLLSNIEELNIENKELLKKEARMIHHEASISMPQLQ